MTLHGLKPLVISAPFGNYVTHPGATATVGTHTLHRRAGFLLCWWRVLTTVRRLPRIGATVNRLGLPSPGIGTLAGLELSADILSVHGFDRAEWCVLANVCRNLAPLAVEANLSCPNVSRASIAELVKGAVAMRESGRPVIAKLPPLRWLDFARPLWEDGVRAFHLCNTLPCPAGGLGGKPVKALALWAVEEVRQTFGAGALIIGGNGVTCPQDVAEYQKAGADCVAVGSALMNPLGRKSLLDSLAGAAKQAPGKESWNHRT